jgi:hypothetical protein
MTNPAHLADSTAAVFSNGDDLLLVFLEEDDSESAAAEAASRGYSYAGCVGICGGVPTVQTEPGCGIAMTFAGIVFAQRLIALKQERQPLQSPAAKESM